MAANHIDKTVGAWWTRPITATVVAFAAAIQAVLVAAFWYQNYFPSYTGEERPSNWQFHALVILDGDFRIKLIRKVVASVLQPFGSTKFALIMAIVSILLACGTAYLRTNRKWRLLALAYPFFASVAFLSLYVLPHFFNGVPQSTLDVLIELYSGDVALLQVFVSTVLVAYLARRRSPASHALMKLSEQLLVFSCLLNFLVWGLKNARIGF